jgi:hypothetical protein
VPATVWGAQAGTWINLTTNANHAIVWSSDNTNIATVDIYGNVTGMATGTANISARYPALGLSAVQPVQVVTVPTMLVHRYSFNETGGTVITDSIGGSVWNGTLPRGGTFSGSGQLTLASNLQQYAQLPSGILSNYTQVSLEMWVTFPDEIAANCFLFGFGTFSGGTGYNYIFCAPRAGRAAITSGNYSGEQNAYTGADFSYHNNLHLAFVFNPPAGYLAIYTNGVLAGINNSVTTAFSAVNDAYSWIGRSLYSGDPYPDFTLDEFRIYNGALSPAEIAAADALGANQLLDNSSPSFNTTMVTGNSLILSWPLASAGFTLMSRTNLASGAWSTAALTPPQISGGQWQLSIPMTQNAQYFRLQK